VPIKPLQRKFSPEALLHFHTGDLIKSLYGLWSLASLLKVLQGGFKAHENLYLHKLFPIGHGSCPESTRNLDARNKLQAKNANIVLVRSGSEIQDSLTSECTCGRRGCSREPRRNVDLIFSVFKQQPAPAGLAFKREEITDDDIRAED
ncbi:hypothetical protein JOQ06_020332, partial [Pogonophryne albipinna]